VSAFNPTERRKNDAVQGSKIRGREKNLKRDCLHGYKKPRKVRLEPDKKCEKLVFLSRIRLFLRVFCRLLVAF
jgi:hypothetical protein